MRSVLWNAVVVPILHIFLSVAISFVDALSTLLGVVLGKPYNSRLDRLAIALRNASDQEEWTSIAAEIDAISGAQAWRANPTSAIYDHKLIYNRLVRLREASASSDLSQMMYLLRGGLLRNLGGLADLRLFRRSLLGTKTLIESYVNEVCSQLSKICNDTELPLQTKLEFFQDTKQSFGNTALVFAGGATFGTFHLGTARALAANGLLPKVVSGSGIGALTAALVCTHTDAELAQVLTEDGINLSVFEGRRSSGSLRRRLARFLKTGSLFDVSVLEEFVRINVGDMTFAQAYARTGRALNILVSSSRTNEVPQLLNYLTAPSVLIWSAACCSAVSSGLFERSVLLAKDSAGHSVVFHPSQNVTWSENTESPELRLQEIYNCNHFIVSSADPVTSVLQPSDTASGYGRIFTLLRSEIRFRLAQLAHLGLAPRTFSSTDRQYEGHIVCQPSFRLGDLPDFFASPSKALIAKYLTVGERATWPLLSAIRVRTAIETSLTRCVTRLGGGSDKASSASEARRVRTKSMH